MLWPAKLSIQSARNLRHLEMSLISKSAHKLSLIARGTSERERPEGGRV
jgi:hypothetical protein